MPAPTNNDLYVGCWGSSLPSVVQLRQPLVITARLAPFSSSFNTPFGNLLGAGCLLHLPIWHLFLVHCMLVEWPVLQPVWHQSPIIPTRLASLSCSLLATRLAPVFCCTCPLSTFLLLIARLFGNLLGASCLLYLHVWHLCLAHCMLVE